MPKPPTRTQWFWGILGTVVGGTLVAVIVNFVVLPARDRMKERSELAKTVDRQELRLKNMEHWQREMQRWKEAVIANTGVTAGTRAVFSTMPAPAPMPTDTGR